MPSAKLMLSTVTTLAVNTSFELKVAVPVTPSCSPATKPAVMAKVGAAVVLPSYTLFGAVALAVKAAGVTVAEPV